jgi:hypothetical protein
MGRTDTSVNIVLLSTAALRYEVLDFLILRAEGFSCSLDVLHGGLGINLSATLFERKDFLSALKF